MSDIKYVGFVKWYDQKRGFGVILVDDEYKSEIFLHHSNFNEKSKVIIKENDKLKFNIKEENGKICAKNIIPFEGEFKKLSNDKNNNRRRPKNTTDFNPNFDKPDMRVITHIKKEKFNTKLTVNDVVIIPEFVDNSYYDKIISELKNAEEKFPELWKEWHGNNHLIADDKLKWKQLSPTFTELVNLVKEYFDMRVEATRLNWYRDDKEWKPYHHDAAAIKEDKAKTQNITVGLSLGRTRETSFQHAKSDIKINIPLDDGSIYTFSKDVNIEWKHGIPQIEEEKRTNEGRISIILWGYVDQMS